VSTAFKQIELDILAALKDGGVQSSNLRVLAERVFILDNSFRGNKDAAELSTEYFNKFKSIVAEKPNSISKNEAVDLIVKTHSRTYSGTDTNTHQLLKILFEKHLSTPESIKSISTNTIIDLLLFFQRPEKRMSEFRTKTMPLIEERMKNLS